MEDNASPLTLRRRLRTELLAARLSKELTQHQVATAMEWSLSKMNRIEKARSGISTNDLNALLRLYDITDKKRIDELVALAREARRSPWWKRYSDVAPPALLELIDYESAASAVSQFETSFVPGILQTGEYASAVLQFFYDETTVPDDETSVPDQVAALVDLRTRRKDLVNSENAPIFSFVLDESVIRRLVGSPAITSRQLMHLVDVATRSNVTIQVVPFTAGLHPGMKGPFEVVQFEDTPDENMVFLEGPSVDIIKDDPKETRNYLAAFEHITEISLGPSDSLDRLRAAAGEMA